MQEVNFDWRDDDPDFVPGVTGHHDNYEGIFTDLDHRDPMEIMSDQDFLDWVEGKDLI